MLAVGVGLSAALVVSAHPLPAQCTVMVEGEGERKGGQSVVRTIVVVDWFWRMRDILANPSKSDRRREEGASE
jgi:hypothetical protein